MDHSRPVFTRADNLREGIDSGSKGYLDKYRTGVCASLVHFALLFGSALLLAARSQAGNRRRSRSSGAGFGAQGGLHRPCRPAASLLVSVSTSSLRVHAVQAGRACSQAACPVNPGVRTGSALQGLLWPLWRFSVASQGQRHGVASRCLLHGCGRETTFLAPDPYRSPRSWSLPAGEARQPWRRRRRRKAL